MANNITFFTGTRDAYNSLTTKDPNGIYFTINSGDKIGKIYKGNDLYSGDELAIASSSNLGGIKVSDDFEIDSDGTLHLYVPISISSFSNDKGTNEIGSSVSSATFSWSLNKVPTTLSLSSGSLTNTLTASKQSNSLVSFATPITSNTTFTLTAADSRKTVSGTSSINFLYGVYYGVSSTTATNSIDSTFVRSLTRQLQSGYKGTYNVNASSGQYIYFCYLASLGTPDFAVNGFSGGFNLVKTFDFTNASGNTSSYNVYRSTNANLGSTRVVIS